MFLARVARSQFASRASLNYPPFAPHRCFSSTHNTSFLSSKKEVTATTARKPTTVVASPRPKGALRFEHKRSQRPSKNVVTALPPTSQPPPAPYIVKKRHSFVYRFFKSIFTRWSKQQRLERRQRREERKKRHLAGQPKGRDIARLLYYYRATRKPYYFKHWLRMSGYNTRKIWQSIKTKSETFVAEKLTQNNEPLDLSETNLAPTITAYPTYSRMLPDGTHEVDIKGTISVPGEWTSRKNRFILNMVRSYLSGNSEEKLERDIAALEEIEKERQGRMSTRGFRSSAGTTQSASTPDLIDLDDGASISSRSTASSRASSVRDGYESPSRTSGRRRVPPPPASRIYSSRTTSIASSISLDSTASSQTTPPPDASSMEDSIMKERFAPFVAQPLVNAVLDITIIDDKEHATSTTLHSHTSGKFGTALRLDFKPTVMKIHVRNTPYSVQQDLMDVSYEGVSLISDIDDTIKHTGVTGDKKAMIKNVFVKDLDGLSIPGVVEWYNKLSGLGVQTHYVSNSPWQLYPVIKEYLHMHGFPRGSIHLKDYAGVLSQLFEAPAERKKFNLEQILRDFPQRRFILVGDSGEGDLEAYVELAKVYPQQVLGIYIRDITSDRELDYDFLRVEIAALKKEAEERERPQKVARKPVQPPNIMDAPIGKKVPPPVPRKPVGLAGKKTDENVDHSGKLDSASSNAAIAATAAFGAPPLPPRRKIQPETMRSISDQVNSGSVNVAASQETDETPRLYSDNDRQFKWKERVRRARRELPANVRLRLWKEPPKVEGETLELAKTVEKQPIRELL